MKLSEATQFLRSKGYLVEKHVLNQAAKSKDDEFYTYMKDIVKELKHYNFSGKIVYCCCDNPEWSNFYKYFEENFDTLSVKLSHRKQILSLQIRLLVYSKKL